MTSSPRADPGRPAAPSSALGPLTFLLPPQPPCFHNALRRALIAHVPVWGVERVEVLRNTSLLSDEVIAWRVRQVPLRGPPPSREGEKTYLVLDARVPDDVPVQRITSRAIECEDPRFEIVHGEGGDGQGLLLATLGPGQHIQLAAQCTFASAYALREDEDPEVRRHAYASHSPACFVGLAYGPASPASPSPPSSAAPASDAEDETPEARLELESVGQLPARALLEAARAALLRRIDNCLLALQ